MVVKVAGVTKALLMKYIVINDLLSLCYVVAVVNADVDVVIAVIAVVDVFIAAVVGLFRHSKDF